MIKKIFIILVFILTVFLLVNGVNAASYTVSNSTDVDTISKMLSGEVPIKNSKFIKNGDTIKFKEGNYYNLKLNVKKSIAITNVKKAKVRFIGNNSGIGINLTNKNKKVSINNILIRNYSYGIYGQVKSGKITNNVFHENKKYGIYIKSSKTKVFNNKFIQNANGLHLIGNKNTISYNKANGGKDYFVGLYVKGNNNSVIKNKVKTPSGSGIEVIGNKNKITKNNATALNGMYIWGSKNLISYNLVISKYCSIDASVNKSKIVYNTVKNSDLGLHIGGRFNLIYYNNIYKNKLGISYYKKTGNDFYKNKFLKNNKKIKSLDIDPREEI